MKTRRKMVLLVGIMRQINHVPVEEAKITALLVKLEIELQEAKEFSKIS